MSVDGTANQERAFTELVKILKNMTRDWDSGFEGTIERETCIMADLGFESIDVVQLVVAIEEHFQRRDFPFEQLLMENGRYVEDIRVGDTADFLARFLTPAA